MYPADSGHAPPCRRPGSTCGVPRSRRDPPGRLPACRPRRRVAHGQRQPDRGRETVAAQDGCTQWWPTRTAMHCPSGAAPTSSGWQPSRTNQRACILRRVPDHSEPGKETHFPDCVAEQLALVGRDRWLAGLADVIRGGAQSDRIGDAAGACLESGGWGLIRGVLAAVIALLGGPISAISLLLLLARGDLH